MEVELWKELFDLSGRVALVTGGTKGLGFEISRTLASSGARVALCSRHAEEAQAVAKDISTTSGSEVIGLRGDVSNSAEISELINTTRERLGPVDILIANAGTNIRKPSEDMTAEEWDKVVGLNLRGPFLVAKAVLPEMRANGYGRVVFVGSIHSFISLPGYAPYSAGKAGLLGLTRALALEYASHGVCVNSICPGFIETPLTTPVRQNPEMANKVLERTPIGRWGSTKDIRGAILLLSSPGASFITGTSIVVDGGWTAQ